MLNIHPGLLPAFGGKGLYGLRVHKAVIASGARFSGATVHFVDEQYDTGPILAQAIVPVNPHDTPQMLAARVLKQVDYHMADVSKAPIAYRLSFEMLNVESVMQNCCHEFGCKQHFAAQPIACWAVTAVCAVPSANHFFCWAVWFADCCCSKPTCTAKLLSGVLSALDQLHLLQEHKLYPTAVGALAEGRISWREDGIPIMWTPH